MKRQLWILALLVVMGAMRSVAQLQGNIWITCNVGLDFNTLPPTFFPGHDGGGEGIASIADNSGKQWLFYTDGMEVWNRKRQLMSNGSFASGRLFGSNSSSQTALIVPDPADTMLYYIFTSDWQPYYDDSAGVQRRGINYSVVDMRLDGGLGDVVQKNIPLFKPAAEKLAATQDCTGKGYWVLAHGWNDDRYYAYHVSDTGIAGPVISRTGVNHEYRDGRTDNARGYLKISPNGKRLAAALLQDATVELADFDNATGKVSSSMLIPIGGYTFGLSFSPNSSKLYVVRGADTVFFDSLFQFDLNRKDFLASKTFVASSDRIRVGQFGVLQITPYGTIVVGHTLPYLAVIERPNELGTACRYVDRWMDLKGSAALVLPNLVDSWYDPNPIRCLPPQARFTISDSVVCLGECFRLQDTSRPSAQFGLPSGRLWRFPGAWPDTSTLVIPPPLCYDSAGTFTVELIVFNEFGSDTARATLRVVAPPTVSAGRDTSICSGDTLQLHGTGSGTLSWAFTNDLSCWNCPDPIAVPRQSASYILTARNSTGCVSHDTIHVTVADSGSLRVEPVDSICAGERVMLRGVLSAGIQRVQWTPTTGLACDSCAVTEARPTTTTLYRLQGVTACGIPLSDSVLVVVHPQPQLAVGLQGDSVLCVGEATKLRATSDVGSIRWHPSEGLTCDSCAETDARPLRTTTYTATVLTAAGCTTRDSITVRVADPPTATALGDTTICSGGTANLRVETSIPISRVRWTPSNGLSCDTCPTTLASPTATTTYRVLVETTEGCQAEDSVKVEVNQPQHREFSIGREYRVGVGGAAEVSIQTQGTSATPIEQLELVVAWNERVAQLVKPWGSNGVTTGSATVGWDLQVSNDTLGKARIVLRRAGGVLPATGEVARLNLRGFVGDSLGTELQLSATITPTECLSSGTTPGRLEVDSICGLSLRLMEVGDATYALLPNTPNPFNPVTKLRFVLGLSGRTVVEIVNIRGEVVARLLDQELPAGEHELLWDAGGVSSGMYYCRVWSGMWRGEQAVVVVK